jgi:K+-sensing histidine kinase KdpD
MHDIKTPVAILDISLQNIEFSGEKNEVYGKYINTAKKHCGKIIDILQNAADFSKIINNRMELNLTNIEIVSFITDVIENMATITARKNLSVVFKKDTKVKYISVDVNLFERVLLNLLSNSVKFSPMNGKITIKLNDLNNKIILTVSDEGDGFPEENLFCIFERYYTLSNEYNPNGSGLGLCIVKEIIERHGGAVRAANGLSGGAVVSFMLPVTPRENTADVADWIQTELA